MTAHGADRAAPLPAAPLARLRLLVALDALLVSGSVAGAARMLGLSAPAMSRILSQLRRQFDDDLLVRAGRDMVPTPRAARLRDRVRGLALAVDAVMADEGDAAPPTPAPPPRPAVVAAPDLPALATVPATAAAGPGHADRARLAGHIATVGGGRGRARPLRLEEAADAFRTVLDGHADPVQIGALLTALQMRGPTAVEIAGFLAAAAPATPMLGAVDLDWPAYISPRNRRAPFALLAARALAAAGHRVLLHGLAQAIPQCGATLAHLGIPVAASRNEAAATIKANRIAFLPLPAIAPQLQALVGLYALFDMRSAIHAMIPLLNPLGAPVTLLAVRSAGAARLSGDAALLLGHRRLLCVANNRDIAQATPHRATVLHWTDDRGHRDAHRPADPFRAQPRVPPGHTTAEACAALWDGRLRDADALAVVRDTIALALLALGGPDTDVAAAQRTAVAIWDGRHGPAPARPGRGRRAVTAAPCTGSPAPR